MTTPLAMAGILWATVPEHELRWICDGRLRASARALDAIRIVHAMLRRPLRSSAAWLGTIGHWVAAIAALYAACACSG